MRKQKARISNPKYKQTCHQRFVIENGMAKVQYNKQQFG